VPSVVALVVADGGHGQHDQPATDSKSATSTAEHGASKREDSSGDGGPGLAECLAMLSLLFAVSIGAALAARRARPLVILRRVRTKLVLSGRPPDPPCLHRLSILRC